MQTVSILNVRVTDTTIPQAVGLLESMIREPRRRTRTVYFVNAHTLNLSAGDAEYRTILNAADYVFGDGTGVRWAARLHGVKLQDNVNGTDLTPALLTATSGRGYRLFLVGGDDATIERAAQHVQQAFPGWTLVGQHQGYIHDNGQSDAVVAAINAAQPHLVLVGMGNPLQEKWIHAHRDRLSVHVCLAVGGLFGYWAGNINRAPSWLRRHGLEWLGILLQQPKKAKRYLLGNPLFVGRILIDALRNLRSARRVT